jgi:LPXTG-motif cell wall-anchored protein
MSRNARIVTVMIAMLVLGAVIASAQTTSYEVKKGTVVQVYGNHLVVKMADGQYKDIDVPEGFMFDVGGKQVPVSALTPGTELTATIATTTSPVSVQVTEVKKGYVVKVSGQTVVLRGPDGKYKQFSKVPENVKLMADGKEVSYKNLQAGQYITAYIVSEGVEEVTEQQVGVTGTAPAPAPKPAPAPAPVAAPAPAPKPAAAPAELPHTASSMPLVGLAGLALLILGIGIAVLRRM